MYQHYRKQEKIELISISGRDDEVNKEILDGGYIKGERDDLIKLIFSDWIGDEDDYLYIGDNVLQYPIFDNGVLREKSLYERYIDGEYTLGLRDVILNSTIYTLSDGQYVEDGEIKSIEKPDNLIRPIWNKDTHTWQEGMTKEELQEVKTSLILEHNKKRKEIATLNEESEYFDVSESVAKANSELEKIRAKINEIDKVIEWMDKQQ